MARNLQGTFISGDDPTGIPNTVTPRVGAPLLLISHHIGSPNHDGYTDRSVDPRLEYQTRLNARRKAVEQGEAAHARLAYVRIGLVFLFVLAAVASLSRGTSWWWLLPPAGAFVVVALIHDRVIRQK